MARPKKTDVGFAIKEVNIEDARRKMSGNRGRSSRFDPVVAQAAKLAEDKALQLEELPYSQVLALRKKVTEQLGDGWKVDSVRVGELYDVLLYRKATKEHTEG
jgi:hypothetical protein